MELVKLFILSGVAGSTKRKKLEKPKENPVISFNNYTYRNVNQNESVKRVASALCTNYLAAMR
jgi:hypothetical protein